MQRRLHPQLNRKAKTHNTQQDGILSPDVVTAICEAILSDDVNHSERLVSLYAALDPAAQDLIDRVLIIVCGYSLPTAAGKEANDSIALTWHIDDVKAVRPDLTDHQTREVLHRAESLHDAKIDMSWGVLRLTPLSAGLTACLPIAFTLKKGKGNPRP